MTRQELYQEIKKNKYQEEILKTFGRNFTQVKSDELANFIFQKDTHTEKSTGKAHKVTKATDYDRAFVKIVSILQFKGVIDASDADEILSMLN